MLDVHPPHPSTHTWRDFFIHIATICIGLLIAIGLEQTVEALHRVHERNILIEDIHTEAEHNAHVFDENIRSNSIKKAWLRASIVAIDAAVSQLSPAARKSDAPITVVLPDAPSSPTEHAPSHAVWNVAKANGKVALLPENLAEVYDRLDYDAEQFFQARDERLKAEVKLAAFETRYGVSLRPGVTVRLSPTALDQLTDLMSLKSAGCQNAIDWTSWWAGAADSVLHNAQTRDEMVPYLDRHHAELPQ